MRLYKVLSASLWLIVTPAWAFDLDGFFSGMKRADVIEKLTVAGLTPKPSMSGQQSQIVAGIYDIAFCSNGRIAAVTKTIDFREFNAYLLSMIANHGEPRVDIPSADLDILYLRWTLNDRSEFSLNSGTNDNGRFHNVGAIDNSFCQK